MQAKNLDTAQDIAAAFAAFLELRPALANVESFVGQVLTQQKQGYQLVAISEGDEIVACIGFRVMTMLAWGKFLYIDDLITKQRCRGKGYARFLLDHVTQVAKDRGCDQVHLDTGYARHTAHRVYLNHGFEFGAFHLALKLK